MTSGLTPDSGLRSLAERVLGRVPSAAAYADVRVVRRRHDGLHVEGESVGQVLTEESEGIGLRVLLDGQWGFACTARLDDLDRIVRRAVDQAHAAAGLVSQAFTAHVGRRSSVPPVARFAHGLRPVPPP